MVANRKPRRAPEHEAAIAQRDLLRAQLRAVLKLVDRKAFQWPADQSVLDEADALLAEAEGW